MLVRNISYVGQFVLQDGTTGEQLEIAIKNFATFLYASELANEFDELSYSIAGDVVVVHRAHDEYLFNSEVVD